MLILKKGLYTCIERMVLDPLERCKIALELEAFNDVKVLFSTEFAKVAREKNLTAKL